MKKVDEIIKELCEIEPSFIGREAELRGIVSELLRARPDTKLDHEFVARLRARLIGTPKTARPILSPFFNLREHWFMASTVVAAILLIIIVLPSGDNSAFKQTFTRANKSVFGEINSAGGMPENFSTSQNDSITAGSATFEMKTYNDAAPTPTKAAMTVPAVVSTVTARGIGGGGGVSSASVGIAEPSIAIYPPQPVTVMKYVYKGEDFDLDASEGLVYKRVKNSAIGRKLAADLGKLDLGIVNLSKFSDMELRRFEIAEDRDGGYLINVDFNEGYVSINQDYGRMSPILNDSVDAGSDGFPSDSILISIAEKFFKSYGLNRSIYGEPVMDRSYMDYPVPMPMPAVDGDVGVEVSGAVNEMAVFYGEKDQPSTISVMPPYWTDSVNIIFPLTIKGIPVYEDGGHPYGLQMNISVADKKVQNVYNITSQDYEFSSYRLTTDKQKIFSVLASGGLYSYMPEGMPIRKVEMEVGTPERILLHRYVYNNGENSELFVPALMFPIIGGTSSEYYYNQKAIIVPLVEDLLNIEEPVYRIM